MPHCHGQRADDLCANSSNKPGKIKANNKTNINKPGKNNANCSARARPIGATSLTITRPIAQGQKRWQKLPLD